MRFRLILFTVIVFYFTHSQVTPYFHFHHHDYKSNDELTILAESSHDECKHVMSCKVHIHSHEVLKVDWNALSNTKNIQLYNVLDPLKLLPDIFIDNCGEREVLNLETSFYKLKFILPNYSNKAPPLCT